MLTTRESQLLEVVAAAVALTIVEREMTEVLEARDRLDSKSEGRLALEQEWAKLAARRNALREMVLEWPISRG